MSTSHWVSKVLFGVLGGVGVLAASVGTGLTARAGGYEEPAYTLVESHPGFEVRRYAPTIEAQVTVEGSYSQAVRAAFGVLAGYIFGGNSPGASIAMTTPVSASPNGERIAMTTPVSAAAVGEGWTVSFTMPASWTMQTLPAPNDARVRLVEVQGAAWAVRAFGGRASDPVVAAQVEALRGDAAAAGVPLVGAPVVSQFDPPWVMGPWRRNEVRLAVLAPPG
jgi:hypothetical protein